MCDMTPFHLDIVTVYGSFYSAEVESVLVFTDEGEVEILAGHADFLAPISTGRAKITELGGKQRLACCCGGFISVNNRKVKLVSTSFEFAEEINLSRAMAAKEKAESEIEKAASKREIALAKAKLKRAITRISIANKAKRN